MSTTQTTLLTSTIFLFIMGAWPIAFITAVIFISISLIRAYKKDKNQNSLRLKVEQLEKENEALRQELADQAVRRAMDKAENREKKD